MCSLASDRPEHGGQTARLVGPRRRVASLVTVIKGSDGRAT